MTISLTADPSVVISTLRESLSPESQLIRGHTERRHLRMRQLSPRGHPSHRDIGGDIQGWLARCCDYKVLPSVSGIIKLLLGIIGHRRSVTGQLVVTNEVT